MVLVLSGSIGSHDDAEGILTFRTGKDNPGDYAVSQNL
jgi:hypothetical protein